VNLTVLVSHTKRDQPSGTLNINDVLDTTNHQDTKLNNYINANPSS
jgi:hypothetical protein